MKVLVVTGGIGSGKSHIVRMFKALNIPVYLADDKVKEIYYKDKELIDALVNLLGDSIIADGKLNKQAMSSIIFGDKAKLNAVEELVHPALLKDFYKWKDSISDDTPFVIFESAIYFEKQMFHKIADKVLVVTSPLDLRFNRVMARDNVAKDVVLQRMSHQLSEEERVERADYIVVSNEVRPLIPQIEDIYNKMISL